MRSVGSAFVFLTINKKIKKTTKWTCDKSNASIFADEELSTLKGIEGETSEDKPPQQVNMAMRLMTISL